MATEDDASNEKYCGENDKQRFLFTLKPDAHIPGYTGHCPYLRDTYGETFSTATWAAHIIRQDKFSLRPASAFPRLERTWKKDEKLMDLSKNKLNCSRSSHSINDLRIVNGLDQNTVSLPNIVPAVRSKHHLDRLKQICSWTRKGNPDELPLLFPISGYSGHVPRLHVTSTGLGLRFSEAVRLSLALFDREMETSKQWRKSIYKSPSAPPQTNLVLRE